MTSNQIAFAKLQEEKRHNQASESQLGRELEEAKRHSVVTEVEAGRHNTATEIEQARHNVITERETERANKMNEGLKSSSIAEDIRSHQATEALRQSELEEQTRSHRMNERLKQEDVWTAQNVAAENARHNLIVEGETGRHNVETEVLTHAEADKTRASIPGVLADATFTNQRSNLTHEQIIGQGIENKYKGALMKSQINANTARAVKDSWSSVLSLIGNVGVGSGLMQFGVNAFNGSLLTPGYSLITQ